VANLGGVHGWEPGEGGGEAGVFLGGGAEGGPDDGGQLLGGLPFPGGSGGGVGGLPAGQRGPEGGVALGVLADGVDGGAEDRVHVELGA
jgi:hypothetical protein